MAAVHQGDSASTSSDGIVPTSGDPLTALTGSDVASTGAGQGHAGHFPHPNSTLDCWSVCEVLTDGLIAAKAERRDALLMHDHAPADRALGEVRELTVLCAATAEAIALQRARWMTGNRPWPLSRVMIQITPSPVSGRNGSSRAVTGPIPPERPSSRLWAYGGCGRGKVGRVPASTRNLRRGPRGPADLLPPPMGTSGIRGCAAPTPG